MTQDSVLSKATKCDEQECLDVRKGKLDTIILRYMTRRLHLIVHELDQVGSSRRTRPMIYKLQERRDRTHRIAIYRPSELLVKMPLSFVGFMSRKQKYLPLSTIEAINIADKKLVEELADMSGILSHTSLELQNGDWCNLVLLENINANAYITDSRTHQHAAYFFVNSYYEWIRLHNGILPEGLDHMEMQLEKTRYYSFCAAQSRPSIREIVYTTPHREQPIAPTVPNTA